MNKEHESHKKSYALSFKYYDELAKQSENKFYRDAFPLSLLASHKLTLRDENKNEFKVFNYDLFYLIKEEKIPVRFGGEELTISGRLFFTDYMEGYKDGQRYFNKNYTLSNDALYRNEGKELAQWLAGKFIVNGKSKTKGWNFIFNSKPFILSAKSFYDYGYYAGIVYELQTLLFTHDKLLEHFKEKVTEFNSPCFEIIITHSNNLALVLRKHESLLDRLNGWYEQGYKGELIARVKGFAAWLFKLRSGEKTLFDIKRTRGLLRNLKTLSKTELYQRYFNEKLTEANYNRLSGSHLTPKEFAATLLTEEKKHLSDFSQFEKYISDFTELRGICFEFTLWLAEVTEMPDKQVEQREKPFIVKEYALTYILDLYANGKQIPQNPIEGGLDAKAIMQVAEIWKGYTKTPDAFYREVRKLKKDYNLNSTKDLGNISKRWLKAVKKLSNNWQETKAYLIQNELYTE